MVERVYRIARLSRSVDDADIESLAGLLVEAVASGAAVSFLAPLDPDAAAAWWRETLARLPARAIVLVARVGGTVVGTVQLQPAWAPNQPHRAEVVKLLVRADHQSQGLGAALMRTLEHEAQADGFRLLTLDARANGAADRLYRRLGWIAIGTIPDYALDTDGTTPHDAVFFYKRLD